MRAAGECVSPLSQSLDLLLLLIYRQTMTLLFIRTHLRHSKLIKFSRPDMRVVCLSVCVRMVSPFQ